MGGGLTKQELVARLDALDKEELEINKELRQLQIQLNEIVPEDERIKVRPLEGEDDEEEEEENEEEEDEDGGGDGEDDEDRKSGTAAARSLLRFLRRAFLSCLCGRCGSGPCQRRGLYFQDARTYAVYGRRQRRRRCLRSEYQ